MKMRKFFNILTSIVVITSMLFGFDSQARAQTLPAPRAKGSGLAQASAPRSAPALPSDELGMSSQSPMQMRTTTQAMRNAAALNQRQQQKAVSAKFAGINQDTAKLSPLGVVANGITTLANGLARMANNIATDYFGVANWTNSPLPQVSQAGVVTGGMRKFVDTLPGLGSANANDLGQYISLGVPDTTTFPGNTAANPSVVPADYYEIGVVEYYEQLHRDLPGPQSSDPTLRNRPGTKLRGYV